MFAIWFSVVWKLKEQRVIIQEFAIDGTSTWTAVVLGLCSQVLLHSMVRVLSTWYDQAAGRHRGMHACIPGTSTAYYLYLVPGTSSTWYLWATCERASACGYLRRGTRVRCTFVTRTVQLKSFTCAYAYCVLQVPEVSTQYGTPSTSYSEYSIVYGLCYAPTNLSWYHTGVLPVVLEYLYQERSCTSSTGTGMMECYGRFLGHSKP